METVRLIILLTASPLFLLGIIAHIVVKMRFRPKDGGDLDNCYYEFEDQHPELARYSKWSQITFIVAVISALLLFIAIAV